MPLLRYGLDKLNRADPSIEFSISKKGEFVLSTCGEVHLEKCL
jgi:translation elongation factor EF-G